MEKDELDQKVFEVVKSIANNRLAKQKCKIDEMYMYRQLEHPDLSDARVLFRMVAREVTAHNARLQTNRTIIGNMKYKSYYQKSTILSGLNIPYEAIRKYLEDNPTKSSYDCYRFIEFGEG
jgi:hypothetical protein